MIAGALIIQACSNREVQKPVAVPVLTQEQFLDTLQYYSFLFFTNEINESTGIVKDRTPDWSACSIAATGFGVASWIVGVERGWITREQGIKYVKTLVKFLEESDQRGDTNSTGYKGFYYHFLDMQTGRRTWQCELSSIDTGLLIAGLITAREYFDGDTPDESYIRNTIDFLIRRIEWDWMIVDKKDAKSPEHIGAISMGWHPVKKSFHDMGWTGYNEALVLYVMAAGGNFNNAESAYDKWHKTYEWKEPYPGLYHAIFPPLFGHQYSHMFIDTRGLYDTQMSQKKIDYFENSRRAVLTQQKYAIENPSRWTGYDSLTWGFTASDGPGDDYDGNGLDFLGYAGRGSSGKGDVFFDDGTIAPTAAGGSIPFAPEVCIPTLYNIYQKYGPDGLWGKYGLKDAFNPTVKWFGPDYLGIDQGPIVIMIENYRSGLIWKYFMKNKSVQAGLKRLGFRKG